MSVQCIFVWSSGFHLNFSSGHQDVVYLILSSRNSVLEGDDIYTNHTNIAKYVQKFPVNDVPELDFGLPRCMMLLIMSHSNFQVPLLAEDCGGINLAFICALQAR